MPHVLTWVPKVKVKVFKSRTHARFYRGWNLQTKTQEKLKQLLDRDAGPIGHAKMREGK